MKSLDMCWLRLVDHCRGAVDCEPETVVISVVAITMDIISYARVRIEA